MVAASAMIPGIGRWPASLKRSRARSLMNSTPISVTIRRQPRSSFSIDSADSTS